MSKFRWLTTAGNYSSRESHLSLASKGTHTHQRHTNNEKENKILKNKIKTQIWSSDSVETYRWQRCSRMFQMIYMANTSTIPLTYPHSPVGLCRRLCGHQWAAGVMLRKNGTVSHVQTNQKDLIPKWETTEWRMTYDPIAPLPGTDPQVHTQIHDHSQLTCSQQPKMQETPQSSADRQVSSAWPVTTVKYPDLGRMNERCTHKAIPCVTPLTATSEETNLHRKKMGGYRGLGDKETNMAQGLHFRSWELVTLADVCTTL